MLEKIKNFIIRRKITIAIVVVLVIIVFLVLQKNNTPKFTLIQPSFGTLARTVKATGQVVSAVDLDLSFPKSGFASVVKVSVGDKVKKGDVLLSLDAANDLASLTKARAALLGAEAKLKKTIAGASNEEISLAQVNLENAKQDLANIKNTQNTLVSNAYNNLLNSTLEASPVGSQSTTVIAPTISGTYTLSKESPININVYSTGNGLMFSASGAVSGEGIVSTTTPQPIGNSGLYLLFTSTTNIGNSNWVINIPNKKASDYLANQNAYQSALNTKDAAISSAQSLVNQREAELALKLASARDADIDLAKADVLSAQGGLEQAQKAYSDNIIKAPADGTITKVDVKYGELATANTPVITLEDIDNLYIEALINESNISEIALNQPVAITFDALPGEKFMGTVYHIDPSSLTSSGVVNYKIKVLLSEKNPNIRSGMNAEISITVASKDNVLSVSKAAIKNIEGKNFVDIAPVKDKSDLVQTEVTLGDMGDGNMIEVLSGVNKESNIAISEK